MSDQQVFTTGHMVKSILIGAGLDIPQIIQVTKKHEPLKQAWMHLKMIYSNLNYFCVEGSQRKPLPACRDQTVHGKVRTARTKKKKKMAGGVLRCLILG